MRYLLRCLAHSFNKVICFLIVEFNLHFSVIFKESINHARGKNKLSFYCLYIKYYRLLSYAKMIKKYAEKLMF